MDKLETKGKKHPRSDPEKDWSDVKVQRKTNKQTWSFIYLLPKAEPKTFRQAPTESRASRWVPNRSICNGSTSRGPVPTLMEATQGEAAAYLHSQSCVSWHLLKWSTETGADVFTSQVKQDGSWAKIILFHDYSTVNTLLLKNFQFFSMFPSSAFDIISSPTIFQAFLGHQVHLSHPRSCSVFTPPWQHLQIRERVIQDSKSPCSSECIAAQAGGHFGPSWSQTLAIWTSWLQEMLVRKGYREKDQVIGGWGTWDCFALGTDNCHSGNLTLNLLRFGSWWATGNVTFS